MSAVQSKTNLFAIKELVCMKAPPGKERIVILSVSFSLLRRNFLAPGALPGPINSLVHTFVASCLHSSLISCLHSSLILLLLRFAHFAREHCLWGFRVEALLSFCSAEPLCRTLPCVFPTVGFLWCSLFFFHRVNNTVWRWCTS